MGKIEIVNVGSMSKVKLAAVNDIMYDSKLKIWPYNIHAHDVSSGVENQPKSLDRIMLGARNRAVAAFEANKCGLGVGIENGLQKVNLSNSGYMELCGCVLYDGKNFYQGLSGAFELPILVTKGVTEHGLDVNEAVLAAGITDNPRLGDEEGIIGLLTRGVIDRKEQTKVALRFALLPLENPEYYNPS